MLAPRAARWTLRSICRLRPNLAPRIPVASAVHFQRRQCSSQETTTSFKQTPVHLQDAPDHRSLGVQQKLFTASIYSPGSPIFLPNGARIFNRLVDFLRKQYVRHGFQEVITPTIYKKSLWAKSGHLENYADDMYTVTSTSPSRADPVENTERPEEEEYGLKPMNCPGHCLIFDSQVWSYRDLPVRYADFSPLHRNEVSGALSGLTRVRRFHQDDGHIFCRPSQIEQEIRSTLDFVEYTYKVLRLGPYRLALSTRPEKHMGSQSEWDAAEDALKRALDACSRSWTLNEGDGAFYGPKIDIILTDSNGKEHQTATIQLDFQLPKRFDLKYTAPAPELERLGQTTQDPTLLAESGYVRPVMIHRAILGSVERLMALLIEHYNGKWPFWLNPRQAIILTLNDSAPVLEYARRLQHTLLGTATGAESGDIDVGRPTGMAVDIDESARPLGTKIKQARQEHYGLIIVLGPKDVESGKITVDTTGIPDAEGFKGERRLEMEPEELLRFMKDQVEAHH
ncbi:Class II aaRS and biotin synthetase [Coniochaeta hoffmannii]|uniref:threonine--tRNA ligase n=1 Tax=Coniochaeta hoffmannii TaxID=91930 RepID=A0AA38VHF7_9PEZI|nr:Class II aaRS and biotin synthetase [Coniochaeta hoffmannii]